MRIGQKLTMTPVAPWGKPCPATVTEINRLKKTITVVVVDPICRLTLTLERAPGGDDDHWFPTNSPDHCGYTVTEGGE